MYCQMHIQNLVKHVRCTSILDFDSVLNRCLIVVNERGLNQREGLNLFLYPLKTSENQRFYDVFRGYRIRPGA